MTTIQQSLVSLIEKWDRPYKLCLTVTGGGMALVDALKIPGASRVFHSIDIPYSSESQAEMLNNSLRYCINPSQWKSVSERAVRIYLEASRRLHQGDYPLQHVAVSAALTSFKIDAETYAKRARRGINSAYVAFSAVWPSLNPTFGGREEYSFQCLAHRIDINKLSNEEIEAALEKPEEMRRIREIEDNKVAMAVISLLLGDPSIMPEWSENESCTRL